MQPLAVRDEGVKRQERLPQPICGRFGPCSRTPTRPTPTRPTARPSNASPPSSTASVEGRVSGHSLRVGPPPSAQSLVAAGASTAELMQAGRWTDPKSAARYAANELAGRGAVARYFEDAEE